MIEPKSSPAIKEPLKGTIAGLLIGILLVMFIGPATDAGAALLIFICMLSGTLLWWVVRALLGTGR